MNKTVQPKQSKKGFTVIELVLFLAVTMMLIVIVMAGTSISIARQRYNDSVNSIAEYLRQAYAEVINIQNTRLGSAGDKVFCTITTAFDQNGAVTKSPLSDNHPGRSNCIIYGKLITFGEIINGKPDTTIHTYDVLGRIHDTNTDDTDANGLRLNTIKSLENIGANVVTINTNREFCGLTLSGNQSNYKPEWQASLEFGDANRRIFTGSVLIVRSPITGTIHTFSSDAKLDVEHVINEENTRLGTTVCSSEADIQSKYSSKSDLLLAKAIKEGQFSNVKNTTFCVGSDDIFATSRRRAIRIHADGRNSSAVEVLPSDSEEAANLCQ